MQCIITSNLLLVHASVSPWSSKEEQSLKEWTALSPSWDGRLEYQWHYIMIYPLYTDVGITKRLRKHQHTSAGVSQNIVNVLDLNSLINWSEFTVFMLIVVYLRICQFLAITWVCCCYFTILYDDDHIKLLTIRRVKVIFNTDFAFLSRCKSVI